jgi:L-amino acid N-acyltransferase YncA
MINKLESKYNFRLAENIHFEQIIKIWEEGVYVIYPSLIISEDMRKVFKNNFNNRKFPFQFWVAEFENNILGWVSILPAFCNPLKHDKEAEISIYVNPVNKNNKLGQQLTNFVFMELKISNLENIWAFVAPHNTNSKKMCENALMKTCGQTKSKIILNYEVSASNE